MSDRMGAVGSSARLLGLLGVAYVLLASPLLAQDSAPRVPRVTISGWFGFMLGGPSSGIEAMVEAGGFGDVLRGGCTLDVCGLEQDFPTTATDPGQGSNLRIGYTQWRRFEVAFSMGTATPAQTDGYSEFAVPDFGRYSTVESQLRMLAVTASLRAGPASIGIGPAHYRLDSWAGDEDNRFDASRVTKVGALLDAGGQFPIFKRVILQLRAQYRLVGSTDVGPHQLASRTLPATPVDFSHGFLGFGLGLAF